MLDGGLREVALDHMMQVVPDVLDPRFFLRICQMVFVLADGIEIHVSRAIRIPAQEHIDFHLPV